MSEVEAASDELAERLLRGRRAEQDIIAQFFRDFRRWNDEERSIIVYGARCAARVLRRRATAQDPAAILEGAIQSLRDAGRYDIAECLSGGLSCSPGCILMSLTRCLQAVEARQQSSGQNTPVGRGGSGQASASRYDRPVRGSVAITEHSVITLQRKGATGRLNSCAVQARMSGLSW